MRRFSVARKEGVLCSRVQAQARRAVVSADARPRCSAAWERQRAAASSAVIQALDFNTAKGETHEAQKEARTMGVVPEPEHHQEVCLY